MDQGEKSTGDHTTSLSSAEGATQASRHPFSLPSRWCLERRLGGGGQAEVWLATDTELGQLVAIKFYGGAYSGEVRARWRHELLLGRSLQHPHLIRIHELIEAEEGMALAMEYMPGGSLAARLTKEGPFPPAQVEEVALHTLEALVYLHSQGIVHRDVKPGNILLDEDSSLRLADLGVAKSLAPAGDATRTGLTPGSPAYMSPEQLQNGDVGLPSDLYSLGVTLYELLAGKLPYEGKSTYEVASGHLAGELPSPRLARPDCPRWLSQFILRLLEKRPEDRFPSAEAALRALETHKGLFSRRMLRIVALRSAALLIVGASAAAGLLAWHREGGATVPLAVRTSYEGNNLRGLDAEGAILWTLTTLAPIQQIEQADLYGDGKRETIVASFDPAEVTKQARTVSAHKAPQVLIVNPEGHILNEFRPEESVFDDGNLVAPPLLWPTVQIMDLLGDGTRQILVVAHHRLLGTAYLWIYRPKQGQWYETLDHWGGWIYAVEPVPKSIPPCLRLLGFNGPLASQPFVAELVIRPSKARAEFMPIRQPVLGADCFENSQFHWYTPLSPTSFDYFDPVKKISAGADGATQLAGKGNKILVDRWGNPAPGPNSGRDLSAQRLDFIGRIGDLYRKAPDLSLEMVHQSIASIGVKFGDLLREEPERAAFHQVCARALARAGDPAGGVQLLKGALKEDGFNDSLLLNLGHLLAIQGKLADARSILEHGYLDGKTPAGGFLCSKVLGRIAIETRDMALLNAKEFLLGSSATTILNARARLWWDEPLEDDTRLESYDLAPEGEAIACLTRWRLHEIKAEDVGLMTDSLQRNPDAAGECLIARAMARLSLGHPNEAVSDCLEAERRLSERAPCEFWAFQTMQLARACHAKALFASDRQEDARALAKEILPHLRPGLLPYLLAKQVLAPANRMSQ